MTEMTVAGSASDTSDGSAFYALTPHVSGATWDAYNVVRAPSIEFTTFVLDHAEWLLPRRSTRTFPSRNWPA